MKTLFLTVSCEELEAIREGRQTVVSKPVRSFIWQQPEKLQFKEITVLAGSANRLQKDLRLTFPFRPVKRVTLNGVPDTFEIEVRA